ncbi:MAG: hypothetical protein C0468_04590 [Planctomyces sp.]|nr:hypothetical protein [Planctomyces sp.]
MGLADASQDLDRARREVARQVEAGQGPRVAGGLPQDPGGGPGSARGGEDSAEVRGCRQRVGGEVFEGDRERRGAPRGGPGGQGAGAEAVAVGGLLGGLAVELARHGFEQQHGLLAPAREEEANDAVEAAVDLLPRRHGVRHGVEGAFEALEGAGQVAAGDRRCPGDQVLGGLGGGGAGWRGHRGRGLGARDQAYEQEAGGSSEGVDGITPARGWSGHGWWWGVVGVVA